MHNIDFPQFLFTLQNDQQNEETNNRTENIYRTDELQLKYEFYGFQSEDENDNLSEDDEENNIEYCKTTIKNPTKNCDSEEIDDNKSETSLHINDEQEDVQEEHISKDETTKAKTKSRSKKRCMELLQEDDDYDLTENGKYKCGRCGKIYHVRAYLKLHLNKNCGGVICKICGQKYRSISALHKHLPVHSDDKNYKCERCGNTYKYKSTLQAHYKYHDELKYVCRICNKKYFTSCKLKVHLSQHAGIFPYKCKICRRTYYSYLRFLRHLEIKHRNRLYILNKINKIS